MQQAAAMAAQEVHAAMRLALAPQEPVGKRAARLRQLQGLVQQHIATSSSGAGATPAAQHPQHPQPGAPAFQTALYPALPALLPLLLDPPGPGAHSSSSSSDLRRAAASAAGTMAAALLCASPPSLLLFQWAAAALGPGLAPPPVQQLPVQPHTQPLPALPPPNKPLSTGQQVAILSAVTEALAQLPPAPTSHITGAVTVPPATAAALAYAVPLITHLLEAPTTGPALLPSLLNLLACAVDVGAPAPPPGSAAAALAVVAGPVAPALTQAFPDLVDLLLGWSLDPGVTSADRTQIHALFLGLQPLWRSHMELAQDLATNLAADLASAAGGATTPSGEAPAGAATSAAPAAAAPAPPTAQDVQSFALLLASLCAILRGAAPVAPAPAGAALLGLLPGLLSALDRALAWFAPQQGATSPGSSSSSSSVPPAAGRGTAAAGAGPGAAAVIGPAESATLIAAVCSTVQQLIPAFRDWIEGRAFSLPAQEPLRAVLAAPCLPRRLPAMHPSAATPAAAEEQRQVEGQVQGAVQKVAAGGGSEGSTEQAGVVPEVRALVAAVFSSILASHGQQLQQQKPSTPAALPAPSPPQGPPTTKAGVVLWACEGALELLLRALQSPHAGAQHAQHAQQLQALLSAAALVLCVAAGADAEQAGRLLQDPRLLGAGSTPGAAGLAAAAATVGLGGRGGLLARLQRMATSQSQVQQQRSSRGGVWAMRESPHAPVVQAFASFLCDVLAMPPATCNPVLQRMLSELARCRAALISATAAGETTGPAIGAGALSSASPLSAQRASLLLAFNAATLQAAVAKGALAPEQLASVGVAAQQLLLGGPSSSPAPLTMASLVQASFGLWAACLEAGSSSRNGMGVVQQLATLVVPTLHRLLLLPASQQQQLQEPVLGNGRGGIIGGSRAIVHEGLALSAGQLLQRVIMRAAASIGATPMAGNSSISTSTSGSALALKAAGRCLQPALQLVALLSGHMEAGVRLAGLQAGIALACLHHQLLQACAAATSPALPAASPSPSSRRGSLEQGPSSHRYQQQCTGALALANTSSVVGAGVVGGAPGAATGAGGTAAESDPLALPLLLAALAMQRACDTDSDVASAALLLATCLSDAAVTALATSAPGGNSGGSNSIGSADTDSAAGPATAAVAAVTAAATQPLSPAALLGPPAWHGSIVGEKQARAMRPAQLARLFELLFGADAAGAAGGMLLRRAPGQVQPGIAPSLGSHAGVGASGGSALGPGAMSQQRAGTAVTAVGSGAGLAHASVWEPWLQLVSSLAPAEDQTARVAVQLQQEGAVGSTAPGSGTGGEAAAGGSKREDDTAATSDQDSSTDHPLNQLLSGRTGLSLTGAELAWLAVQEGAKQCIASRMRTHMGGPTHSFAALERLLQGMHMRLVAAAAASAPSATAPVAAGGGGAAAGAGAAGQQQQPHSTSQGDRDTQRDRDRGRRGPHAPTAPAPPQPAQQSVPPQQPQPSPHPQAPNYESCWLVLEFVQALERCTQHACEGLHGHAPLPRAVLAFFAANRRVCEDWFARVRELLLRIAHLSGAHQSAVYHGWQRLADLRAAAKALAAQQEAAEASAGAGAGAQPSGASAAGGSGSSTTGGASGPVAGAGPTVLKPADREGGGSGSSVAGGGAGPGAAQGPAQGAEAPSTRLVREVVEALRMTSLALLECKEGEALQGLHAWASKSFGPLLQPLRDYLKAKAAAAAASATAAPGAVPAAGAAVSATGAAAQPQQQAGGPPGQGPKAPGQAPAQPGSSAPSPATSSAADDPLLWMSAMAAEAQGRYEAALARYSAFLRQVAQYPSLPPLPTPATAGGMGAAAPAPGQAAAGAAPQPQQRLLTPVQAAAAALLSLHAPVIERCSACYSSLSDWANFRAFVASQHRRAQADPAHAPLWGACVQGQGMQAILALASFDVTGPGSPELQTARPDPAQAAVLAGLQAAVSAYGAAGAGSGSQPPLLLPPGHAQHVLEGAWPAVGRSLRPAAMQGLGRTSQKALTHLSQVAALFAAHGGANGGMGVHGESALAALRMLSEGGDRGTSNTSLASVLAALPSLPGLPLLLSPRTAVQWEQGLMAAAAGTAAAGGTGSTLSQLLLLPELALGRLALPPSVHTAAPHARLSRGAAADPAALTHLLRVHTALDPSYSAPATQALLLALAASGRGTGNLELCARTCERLGALPAVARTPAFAAALRVVRANLAGEAGAVPPAEVASRQVSALQPFLSQPRALAALAAEASAARTAGTGTAATAQLALGCLAPAAAAEDLGAAFLSLASWLGRLPPAAAPAIPSPPPEPGSLEVPLAPPSWHSLLLYFTSSVTAGGAGAVGAGSSSSLPIPTAPIAVGGGGTGALATSPPGFPSSPSFTLSSSPRMVPLGIASSPTRSSTGSLSGSTSSTAASAAAAAAKELLQQRPIVPAAAARVRPAEAVATLSALHVAPHMSRAWLQWGLSLLAWAKEVKGAKPLPAVPPPGASRPPGAPHTAQAPAPQPAPHQGPPSEQVDAMLAAVHALCCCLRLGSAQGEFPEPEDAVPLLLRVLQVVVRHGSSREDALRGHLALCPPTAWQAVTPQLFAQLRNQQPAVRRLALGLLGAVASAAPFAVLYPALAEVAAAEHATSDPSASSGNDSGSGHSGAGNSSNSNSNSQGELVAGLQALLAGLDAARPRLLADVRTLMGEAERLTVTWEERWHSLLSEVEVDVARRCVSLRAEAERLALGGGSTAAVGGTAAAEGDEGRTAALTSRYAALMSPVVLALERALKANAACEPETPAEARFASEVLPRLSAAIAALRSPPPEALAKLATQPQVCWEPVRAVLAQLSRTLREPTLDLAQVCPALAALSHTDVPMPGLQLPAYAHAGSGSAPASSTALTSSTAASRGGTAVTGSTAAADVAVVIGGVERGAAVLATKTRPKRLVLRGSDGRPYVFLLKGRDDLRMDERLMQIMRVANSLLRADRTSGRMGLSSRHYSVTPLGERVGLIQWVGHTVSVFSLFKAWQAAMRERHAAMVAARQEAAAASAAAAAAAAAASAGGTGSSADSGAGGGVAGAQQQQASSQPAGAAAAAAAAAQVPPLPAMATALRPPDLFYAKLLPALHAAGLPGLGSRKQWPLEVLRKVHAGLVRDAPSHLVARTLWGGAGSAAGWWARSRAFSASLAVTSVIGYLVGLGDRHLDNLLLDASCGQVVHIDFNVCFEKGTKLRVPEVVPFRLTGVLCAALGPRGGPDGSVFRPCAEAALGALRARREGLVALLDAVLGDPGVSWAAGEREGAAAAADLEVAVALQLFVARMEEAREALSAAAASAGPLLEGPGSAVAAYVEAHAFLSALKAAGEEARSRAAEGQAALQAAGAAEASARTQLAAALQARAGLAEEAGALQSAAGVLLSECAAWAQRHHTALAAVREGAIPGLTLSPVSGPAGATSVSGKAAWCCADADALLGLLSPVPAPSDSAAGLTAQQGASNRAGLLTEALGPAAAAPYLPQALLDQCASLDSQGAALARARDALLSRGAAALRAFAASLRTLLPPDYPKHSAHARWGAALQALCAEASPAALARARGLAPFEPPPAQVARVWRALRAAHASAAAAAPAPGTEAPAAVMASAEAAAAAAAEELRSLLASLAASGGPGSGQAAAAGAALGQVLSEAAGALQAATAQALKGVRVLGQEGEEGEEAGEGGGEDAKKPVAGPGAELQAQSAVASAPAGAASAEQQLATAGALAAALHQLVPAAARSGLLASVLQQKPQQQPKQGQPPASNIPAAAAAATAPAALRAVLQAVRQAAFGLRLARADVLPDLEAHVRVGGTVLLEQSAALVSRCWSRLEGLLWDGHVLELRQQQHLQLMASYAQQCEALQTRLETLAVEVVGAEAGSSALYHLAGEQQRLQGKLQELHAAWARRDATAAELAAASAALHSALASELRSMYAPALGPGCAAAEAAAGEDAGLLAQVSAVDGSADAAAAAAWSAQPGSTLLLLAPGQDAWAAAAAALAAQQQQQQEAGGAGHSSWLDASMPAQSQEVWGNLAPHHLLGPMTALLLRLHGAASTASAGAANKSGMTGSSAGRAEGSGEATGAAESQGLRVPALLAPWRHRLHAVRALHKLLQAAVAAAEEASEDPVVAALAQPMTAASVSAASAPAAATPVPEPVPVPVPTPTIAHTPASPGPTGRGLPSAVPVAVPVPVPVPVPLPRRSRASGSGAPSPRTSGSGVPSAASALAAPGASPTAAPGAFIPRPGSTRTSASGIASSGPAARLASIIEAHVVGALLAPVLPQAAAALQQLATGLLENSAASTLASGGRSAGGDTAAPAVAAQEQHAAAVQLAEGSTEYAEASQGEEDEEDVGMLGLGLLGGPGLEPEAGPEQGSFEGESGRAQALALEPASSAGDGEDGELMGLLLGLEGGNEGQASAGTGAAAQSQGGSVLDAAAAAAATAAPPAAAPLDRLYPKEELAARLSALVQQLGWGLAPPAAASASAPPSGSTLLSALESLTAPAGQSAVQPGQAVQVALAAHCARRQALRLRHLAAFAWLHEHVLSAFAPALSLPSSGAAPGSSGASADLVAHAMMQAAHQLSASPSQAMQTPLGAEHAAFLLSSSAAEGAQGLVQLLLQQQQQAGPSGGVAAFVTRQQLVAALQAVCEELPRLEEGLSLWESSSMQVAGAVAGALGAAAGQGRSLPLDVRVAVQVLQGYLSRRQQWLAGAREHAGALAQACAAVVQFEVSRQGAAWAPGAASVPDAFAPCKELLDRMAQAYTALGAAESEASTHSAALAAAQQAAAEAGYAVEAAKVEEEAAASQLALNLPMLALGSADLGPLVASLASGLPPARQLLGQDMGAMLRELAAVSARHNAARDVAALAARALAHHAGVAEVLEKLVAVLPGMQASLAAVAAELPLPPAAHAEAQAGTLAAHPALAAAVSARSSALLERLEAPVSTLQPYVHSLLEMGPALQRLLQDIDSLCAAAGSVAAAIQSEHAWVEPLESGAAGGTSLGPASSAAGGAAAGAGTGAGAGAGSAGAAGGDGSPAAGVSRSATPPPPGAGTQGTDAAGQAPGLAAAATTAANTSGISSSARARTARLVWMGRGGSGGVAPAPRGSAAAAAAAQQEARRRAFVAAALRRCIIKLEGRDGWDIGSAPGAAASSAPGAAGASASTSQPGPGTAGGTADAAAGPTAGTSGTPPPVTAAGAASGEAAGAAGSSSNPTPTGAGRGSGPQQQGGAAQPGGAALPAPLTVPAQVELLIRHATSPDNLCQMYEGWMPWL